MAFFFVNQGHIGQHISTINPVPSQRTKNLYVCSCHSSYVVYFSVSFAPIGDVKKKPIDTTRSIERR